MSKEKQIEEIAKSTMKHCKIDNQCGSCHWSTCNECLAEILYNAGYRKKSEVIKEFVKRFEFHLGDSAFTLGQTNDIQYALRKATEEMKGGAE